MRDFVLRCLAAALFVAGLSGCFQASLNGPVVGATVTITPANQPDNVIFTTTTSDVADVDPDEWRSQEPLGQLARLGRISVEGNFNRSAYYLVTASGGQDTDADLDKEVDDNYRSVVGEWHVLMTGKQLLEGGRNISALTEAIYQEVADELGRLSRNELRNRLDALASSVLDKDLNNDNKITYEDALRWTRLLPDAGLTEDQIGLDKIALAVQEGAAPETLRTLSNRFFGGPAAFGLDDENVVTSSKREPDGTCDGRGAAIVSTPSESITTFPPTSVCKDKGKVVASSRNTVAQIQPNAQGKPTNINIDGRSVKLQYKQNNKQIRIQSALLDGVVTKTNNSTGTLTEITNAWQRMKQASEAQEKTSKSYGDQAIASHSRAVSTPFSNGLADALSYGALTTNWVACIIHNLFAELEAEGKPVPEGARNWAIESCTSELPEIETWVEEVPPKTINKFEKNVPEVVLEGCADCYSLIVVPESGLVAQVGEVVEFNAVAPASARDVRWDFGDGNSFDGRATEYAYSEPGVYAARFNVVYVNGRSASLDASIDVRGGVDVDECVAAPTASAGSDKFVDAGDTVILAGSGQALGCPIVAYQWSQVDDTGLTVSLASSNTKAARFTAPAVSEPTTLLFKLTVEDSDGGTASDEVAIDVYPLEGPPGGCAAVPEVDATASAPPLGYDGVALNYTVEALGQDCAISDVSWEQLDGPTVELNSDYFGEFGFRVRTLSQSTTFSFQVTAIDSDGNIGSDTVSVTLPATVDGFTVSRITARLQGQGIITGFWEQRSDISWVELREDGVTEAFFFTEQFRDEYSVYLEDLSRGVEVQLDLFTREVKYRDEGDPQQRVIYQLTNPEAINVPAPQTIGYTSTQEVNRVKFENVRINGAAVTGPVSPGSSVSVDLDYSIYTSAGCPSCIFQILIGFSGEAIQQCPVSRTVGQQSDPTFGSISVTVTAPSTPGDYYLAFDSDAQFNCGDAIATEDPIDPNPARYFGVLSVR